MTLLAAGGTLTVQAVTGQAVGNAVVPVPRPDHVVIAVEENHSFADVVGNPDAPYINSLAANGANFTQSFAETHPSQPNYLALFSGSTQGVTDDHCPITLDGPSLGSELIDAGLGFTGYSEGLPQAGYTGCTSGAYARKHAPWVNFSNIPASANQPFSAFPTDYSTLPAVSFVVPNLDNDMHDGTIAQGDAWLQDNLGGYVDWARTHNSLFILTFDESGGGEANHVPTIFVGPAVTPGDYAEAINHFSVLRTVQDAYGLPPLGASATATPIQDVWTTSGGGQPPVASFTATCAALACTFDGSGSSDPDGTVQAYRWDFGDGGTANGPGPVHTYQSAGTYSVTLTVTDDQGLSASTTEAVQAGQLAQAPVVSDMFDRTVTAGLGTADVGGAWSVVGNQGDFSVVPGSALVALPAASASREAYIGVPQTDVDLTVTLALDTTPTSGAVFLSATPRRVDEDTAYRATVMIYPGGWTSLRLSRTVNESMTTIASTPVLDGLRYLPGSALSIRVQASGTDPTELRARVWPATSPEPADWQLMAVDSDPALQAPGTVGLRAYVDQIVTNPPFTVALTSFVAAPTMAPPVNQPPVAAFTSGARDRS